MVAPAGGAVVLVRFPFWDLSQTKLRPAVVLADVGRGDCILCQITSKPYGDASSIDHDNDAFASGSLRVDRLSAEAEESLNRLKDLREKLDEMKVEKTPVEEMEVLMEAALG